MRWLSDEAVERLRAQADLPDLSGTRYRLVRRIGHGGMGAVYLAEDTALARRVALKVLDVPDSRGELAQRMLREARILAQLEHPGIVPVHDVGTLADGRAFYTMKYVEGRRLDRLAGEAASVPDRLRIFGKICEAVAFAHARSVLHRDLKPQNIMVGPFGEVLVMDWGIAKILRAAAEAPASAPAAAAAETMAVGKSATTAHGTVLGTPGYMPPEQERGDIERLDERADIFALGAILRFLLEQHAVEHATTVSTLREGGSEAVHPVLKSSDVPRPLAAVCVKAMAADAADRYASVAELAADVARYLDGLPVSAYPETWLDKASRFLARHRVWVILLLTYLVVRMLLLFWQRR